MERFYKNDYLAVLIAPDFGAGYSTYYGESLAYDKRIIDFIFNNNLVENDGTVEFTEKLKEFFVNEIKVDFCFDFVGTLQVVWIKKGTFFKIKEYDGKEYIEEFYTGDWERA